MECLDQSECVGIGLPEIERFVAIEAAFGEILKLFFFQVETVKKRTFLSNRSKGFAERLRIREKNLGK